MGCLVEGNSTAHQRPAPDLTLRYDLNHSVQAHTLSFLPSAEPQKVGAARNLFPGSFSTTWPLGRRYNGREEAKHTCSLRAAIAGTGSAPERPHIWVCAASHACPVVVSATHTFPSCGLQGPPVPESPWQTPWSHPDLLGSEPGAGESPFFTLLPSDLMPFENCCPRNDKDKRTIKVPTQRSGERRKAGGMPATGPLGWRESDCREGTWRRARRKTPWFALHFETSDFGGT